MYTLFLDPSAYLTAITLLSLAWSDTNANVGPFDSAVLLSCLGNVLGRRYTYVLRG